MVENGAQQHREIIFLHRPERPPWPEKDLGRKEPFDSISFPPVCYPGRGDREWEGNLTVLIGTRCDFESLSRATEGSNPKHHQYKL